MRMLVGHDITLDVRTIQEWTSDDGLVWSESGRTWQAPDHATPGVVYSVFDAGFLKTEDRTIVEPMVVVANISEGTTFPEIVDVTRGLWHLYFWAEAGALLPPNFGDAAHSCPTYEGFVDAVSCDGIAGWAWDSMYTDYPISIDIYDGATFVENVSADLFRQDLLNAGKGTGRHAFSVALPGEFRDGRTHELVVRYVYSDRVLSGGTTAILCEVAVFELAVIKATGGSGLVTSVPAGISCGVDCQEGFGAGTTIGLSAESDPGFLFLGWSGHEDCSDGVVTIFEDLTCAARFGTMEIFLDGFESGDTRAWSDRQP